MSLNIAIDGVLFSLLVSGTLLIKSRMLPTDNTYSHDEWSENDPAGLPPQTGPVANHFLNVVIEFVHT